jgi:hypothetical protein
LKTRHSYVRAGRGQFGDRHGLHVDKDDSPKAVPLKAGKEGDWRNTQAKHPRLPAAPQGLQMGRLELTLRNPAESGHAFRTNPDTEYGPIRTGGRLKADTSK